MAVLARCPEAMESRSSSTGNASPAAWRMMRRSGRKLSRRAICRGDRLRKSTPIMQVPEKAVASDVAAAAPATPHPARGRVNSSPTRENVAVG